MMGMGKAILTQKQRQQLLPLLLLLPCAGEADREEAVRETESLTRLVAVLAYCVLCIH